MILTEEKRQEFIQKQKNLYVEKGLPIFMSTTGYCWNCGQDCVLEEIKRGNDGTTLVTGCRVCHRSFCD